MKTGKVLPKELSALLAGRKEKTVIITEFVHAAEYRHRESYQEIYMKLNLSEIPFHSQRLSCKISRKKQKE